MFTERTEENIYYIYFIIYLFMLLYYFRTTSWYGQWFCEDKAIQWTRRLEELHNLHYFLFYFYVLIYIYIQIYIIIFKMYIKNENSLEELRRSDDCESLNSRPWKGRKLDIQMFILLHCKKACWPNQKEDATKGSVNLTVEYFFFFWSSKCYLWTITDLWSKAIKVIEKSHFGCKQCERSWEPAV